MINLDALYWQRDLADPAYQTDRASFLAEFRDRAKQATQIIEIGVGTGQSTIAFLFGLEKSDGCLWSCDIQKPTAPIEQLSGYPQWTFILGCSTDEAVRLSAPLCDILLIDGARTNRLNDLVIYGPKLRIGGIIYVADVDQRPVREEFDTFVKSHDIELKTKILRGDKSDMGVIYVPKAK